MLLPEIITKIENKFSDFTLDTTKFAGEDIIHIKSSRILEILKLLRTKDILILEVV